MIYSWNTQPVISSQSGTGWALDVTDANLSTRLDERDFVVVFDSDIVDSSQFTKTSPTTIKYNGVATGGVTVEVRRNTDASPFRLVSYADVILSGDYNRNLERVSRNLEEIRQFGNAPIGEVSLSTASYGSNWAPDISGGATRSALFEKFEAVEDDYQSLISSLDTTLNSAISLRAPLESPNFSGSPTAPSPALNNDSTQLATTQFVQGNISPVSSAIALKADIDSPALTGVPTAPNADVGINSNRLATTQFVKAVGAAWETNPVALQNSWSNSVSNTINPVVWRNPYLQQAYVEMNLTRGAMAAGVVGVVPAGFRPVQNQFQLVFVQADATSWGLVIVRPNGQVEFFNTTGQTGAVSQLGISLAYKLA